LGPSGYPIRGNEKKTGLIKGCAEREKNPEREEKKESHARKSRGRGYLPPPTGETGNGSKRPAAKKSDGHISKCTRHTAIFG